jgi:hypothetical protein
LTDQLFVNYGVTYAAHDRNAARPSPAADHTAASHDNDHRRLAEARQAMSTDEDFALESRYATLVVTASSTDYLVTASRVRDYRHVYTAIILKHAHDPALKVCREGARCASIGEKNKAHVDHCAAYCHAGQAAHKPIRAIAEAILKTYKAPRKS